MEQLTREGCFPSPSAPHAVHLFKLQHEFICPTSLSVLSVYFVLVKWFGDGLRERMCAHPSILVF